MQAIVRLALTRPYTFVVLAILILIFGPLAALRTPTDIFPDIGIPVIAVVWTYSGLPPDDMSGRIVYYYERRSPPRSTTSSTSRASRCPASASSRSSSSRASTSAPRTAQVTAALADRAEAAAAGHHPAA